MRPVWASPCRARCGERCWAPCSPAVPATRFGARRCLRWVAALYLLSGIGCFFAWNWQALIAFRFLAGIAVGASSVARAGPISPKLLQPGGEERWSVRSNSTSSSAFSSHISAIYAVGTLALGDLDWRFFEVRYHRASCRVVARTALHHSPKPALACAERSADRKLPG